jgi:hypothetical protein
MDASGHTNVSIVRMRCSIRLYLLGIVLLPLACGRPCSESDVYPGFPLPSHERFTGVARPWPHLIGCSLLDLVNARLTPPEAVYLARAVAFEENGEFRNISVVADVATVQVDGVPIGDAGATILADAFGPAQRPSPDLDRRLAFGAAAITSVGATSLANAIGAAGTTIVSLSLEWNSIGDVGAAALGRALRGSQRLHTLGLERCGIGDEGAAALASALAAPHETVIGITGVTVALASAHLRELRLEGNQIGVAGAAAFGAALATNVRLERLTLALNAIGAQGAAHLATALRTNRALVALDLADCDIGDDGAVALATALRSNTHLRELNLQSNGIGLRGATALADAIRINPSALRSLTLRLNRLDEPAGRELVGAVRHAKTTPQAGAGLDELHLEHCLVLPGVGAVAPPAIDGTLLGELAEALGDGPAPSASRTS